MKFSTRTKTDVLRQFRRLSLYLARNGRIEEDRLYQRDFSAFLSFSRQLAAYSLALPFCTGRRILNAGCFIGTGNKTLAFGGRKIYAVDSDFTALDYGRREEKNKDITFVGADIMHLPFPDEFFGTVAAFQVIEHFPAWGIDRFVRELERVTSTRGMVLLTTPNRSFRLLPFQAPFNPEHHQEFSVRGLRKVLKRIFKEVTIIGVRASPWIEKSEKMRVKQSLPKAYLYCPLSALIKKLAGASGKKWEKNNFFQKLFLRSEAGRNRNNENFEKLFNSFHFHDFYLDNRDPEKAIDLFAICRKVV